LASHKALYTVSLTSSRPGSDYQDVTGKMSLEFTDACEAWTTKQKSLLRTISADGSEELSDSDFTASESKSGNLYSFDVRQSQNGETAEFHGRAKRTADGSAVAVYTKPKLKSYKLPLHVLFQTEQQRKLIELAEKGLHFLNGYMFDGSEGGGAARFNAIILKPPASGAAMPVNSPLLDSPGHRIRIAFYPAAGTADNEEANGQPTADSGDEPEYEMTMTVHENGVVSDYDYDYRDFSVHGRIEAIQPIPQPHC